MTSLGRLIFFDQPGTGASDPVTPGALPTLEQWTDSISAILDDLGSREAALLTVAGAFGPGALFAATHPSRTVGLVVLEGYAYPSQRTGVLASLLHTGQPTAKKLSNPPMLPARDADRPDPWSVGTAT